MVYEVPECWNTEVLLLIGTQHSATPSLQDSMSSSDHFVRSRQYIRWNGHADLFGRLQTDHQFKPGRLLDRKIGWLKLRLRRWRHGVVLGA
jgi:hypothetical protein